MENHLTLERERNERLERCPDVGGKQLCATRLEVPARRSGFETARDYLGMGVEHIFGGFDHLLDLGAKAVVVTLGARGAALHTRDGDTPIAPFEVTPVDTTGAGDTFCGALCARLAAGDELEAALRVASAAAALSTTKAGAVPSIPTRAEIDALMGV